MDYLFSTLTKDLDKCVPYNCCFYSSLVFIINVVIAVFYGYLVYAGLFAFLLLTSLLQHSCYTLATTIIDKIAITSVVVYGGYIFYTKLMLDNEGGRGSKLIISFLIMITFLLTIMLYYYGKINKCFCFCEDNDKSNRFLSLTHYIGSFGHVCIVLL